MANTTWKQVVLDTADAYREANGTTDKIPVGQLAEKVRAGAGVPYEGDNPLTLGSAGYTFPAKTLLKEGLQIINGVNGEDLTDTVADQTTAVEALMRMVSRKIAMNNGEGQYVWKKSEEKLLPAKLFATRKTINEGLTWTLKARNGVLPSLSKADLVGLKMQSGGMYLQITSTTKCTWYFSSSAIETLDWTYDDSTKIITVMTRIGGSDGNEWTVTGISLNCISYEYKTMVVSSDAEAYPNGGEQDGYWYELVEEGVSGIDFGEVTPSSSTQSLTINHSLNAVPKFAVITSSNILNLVSGMKTNRVAHLSSDNVELCVSMANSSINSSSSLKVTSTQLIGTVSGYFEGSHKYYWFALA